jgi:hypothetical protein
VWVAPAGASSHREAPLIGEMPKVDGTDFYMFRSYEPGREAYVTFLANYIPLQDGYGGPNFFELDPNARYRINVENDGADGADIVFEFQFLSRFQDQTIPVGGQNVPHPLKNIGPVPFSSASNEPYQYMLKISRDGGAFERIGNTRTNGGPFFTKATDNIGEKTFPDYKAYADNLITGTAIPGCGTGRVFVGQRRESFAVNLGEVFDLVNLDPVGDRAAKPSDLEDKNITTIALEVPISCLTQGGSSTVIGAWTTAHLPKNRMLLDDPTFVGPTQETGELVQVSRLGMPLVNEVVIGLRDKNLFNASVPSADDVAKFGLYVTNPTLPEILQILFGVQAPNNFPRNDLVATFVTGITGLNALGVGEMLRLNTAIAPTAKANQNNLGVLGGDGAGFPNGRRPGDDVVDIELRVAMGVLCHAFPGVYCSPADAPSGTLGYTDQTLQDASQFDSTFPYLLTPLPGSPNSANDG